VRKLANTHLQQPTFVNRPVDENLFKILEIEELSIYWDSDCAIAGDVSSQRQLAVRECDLRHK
jgi:hypothetical protein